MSNYPSQLDTDAQLPRVADNVTEIGGEAIDALREAVFAVQAALGASPQGATADLVTRLSQSLNDDGTLKASALIAAGLIALPIVNSQVGATAAILESKLDLDIATQVLQDQISSNDIDITALQDAIADLLNRFAQHIAGTAFRHDTSMIDLATALTGIVAADLDTALVAMNVRFINHAATTAVGAHGASNISVVNNFQTISATDAQTAFEELDQIRAIEFIRHRDDMHSNGFNFWANSTDGYNVYQQIYPTTSGTTTGIILGGRRNVFEFAGVALAGLGISQGDVLVITSGTSAGNYIIDDVGPRAIVGVKPALDIDQLETTRIFFDGYDGIDGYVEASVFAQSSTALLKGNAAPTIHQSDIRVDSIQFSRPNAARAVSLGLSPSLIIGTETLVIEAGVDTGAVRTITINNLNLDRNGVIQPVPTVDSVVGRINSVFQNRTDGYAFPVAAYRVGDELMLAHNWQEHVDYTLRVLSTGTANFTLGLDGYGAAIEDAFLTPTLSGNFVVNGFRYSNFATILNGTATIPGPSSTTLIMDGTVNPLALGVKEGHLVQLKSHPTDNSVLGTYYIINVSTTSIVVHTVGTLAAGSGIEIEILHDALPLEDFNTNTRDQIIEGFVDANARVGYNERLSYTDSISNMSIIDVSDNFLAATYDLTVAISGGGVSLTLGTLGSPVIVPTTFSGQVQVYSPANIEFIVVDITSPIGTGTTDVAVNDHINEEEVLELCSTKIDGLLTISNISDKRLYGSVGIEQVREDYTQAFIETPMAELRSNGIARGFGIISTGLVDPALYPSNEGISVLGGTTYVAGVRCDIESRTVIFPSSADGNYTVALNDIGSYQIIPESDYSVAELLDGYNGELALVYKVEMSSGSVVSAEDLRFFINDLDDKFELVVDFTNHMIGNFASFEAAVNYANNYPSAEKFTIRVVSRTLVNDIVIPAGSRDITVELDGSVRNITVGSDCKIRSNSIANRGFSHLIGTFTVGAGCTSLEVENLNIDGYVSLAGTSAQEALFRNTIFTGTSNQLITNGTITSKIEVDGCGFENGHDGIILDGVGTLVVNNCTFSGGQIYSNAGTLWRVTETVFDQAVINGTVSLAEFEGVRFVNHTDPGTDIIAISGLARIRNSIFEDITLSSNRIIGNTDLIDSCIFDTVLLTSTGELINDTAALISNCQFLNGTYINGPSVVCRRFHNNIKDANNEVLIDCSESFVGNTGFGSVRSNAGSAALSLVSGNKFASSSTYGYAVDLTAATVNANPIIIGNDFSLLAGADAITLDSVSENTKVMNNHFEGTDATSSGVAVSNANDVFIHNNTFELCTAVTSTVQVGRLSIVSNSIAAVTATSLLVGDDFTFAHNTSAGGTFTLAAGIAINDAKITDNVSSGIFQVMVPIIDSLVSGNSFASLNLRADMTTSILTNNIGLFTSPVAQTYDRVVCSGNIEGWISGEENVTWRESIISENYFSTSSFTFSIYSPVGDVPALVNISQNIFNGSVIVQATNAIQHIAFVNNMSGDQVSPFTSDLSFTSSLNNSFVSRNINFSISINTSANNTIISENNLTTQDITLAGTVNTTSVSGNFVSTISVECGSTTGLSIAGNSIASNLDIMEALPVSRVITKAIVENNVIVGDLNILNSPAATGLTATFTNSVLNNNFLSGSIYIANSGNIGINDVVNFSNNTISGNISGPNFGLLTYTSVHATSALIANNNTITGNRVGAMTLFNGASFADGYGSAFSNNIFDRNTMDSLDITSGTDNVIDATNFTVSNNIIGSSSTVSGLKLNNFRLLGNTITGVFTFDLTNNVTVTDGSSNEWALTRDLIINDNSFSSNVIIQLRANPAVTGTPLITALEGLRVVGNTMTGLSRLIIQSQTYDPLRYSIAQVDISKNKLRSIEFLNTISDMEVSEFSISNNVCIGDNSVALTPDDPGIYFSNSGSEDFQVAAGSISNNYAGTLFDGTSATFSNSQAVIRLTTSSTAIVSGLFTNISIVGNTGCTVLMEALGGGIGATLSFQRGIIADNANLCMVLSCPTSGDIVTVINTVITSNTFISNSAFSSFSLDSVGSGTLRLQGVTLASNVVADNWELDLISFRNQNVLSGNIAQVGSFARIYFDPSIWSTSTHTRFIGNYFETWETVGVYTDGADANNLSFFWGNTGNGTTNLTVNGVTAVNSTTANNMTTGKINA